MQRVIRPGARFDQVSTIGQATEPQRELGISKANLSRHAMVLRSTGVVVRRREGKNVYFSLAMPEVKKACQLIQHVLRAQIRNGQRLV